MRTILTLILCVCISGLYAQKITQAEYFIDTDKGFGKNTPIAITLAYQNSDITLNFTASLTSLDPGMHTLYVRAKDENSVWSIYATRIIQVIPTEPLLNIVAAEYFIDDNKEPGKGVNIPVTAPASDKTLAFTLDLSGTETGLHWLYTRVKTNNGIWSLPNCRLFYVIQTSEIANIKSLEYYFKKTNATDSTSVYTYSSFTPASTVELKETEFLANTSALTYDQQYSLYVRAQNTNGKYSSYSKVLFTFKKLTTSIDNLQPGELSVYPNPTADYIYIKDGGSELANSTYYIYNSMGVLCLSGSFADNKIDLQTLSHGEYILFVKQGSTYYKGKITVIK